ncbi:MAG: hypothetical protein MI921_19565 [Cytophagales bacterium]|nr:hypothetical protein [Cytophagales bacterium]
MKPIIISCQILIILAFGCSSPKKEGLILDDKKKVEDEPTSKKEISPIIFTYNKIDMVGLNGEKVISKESKQLNGRIEFKKNEIKIYTENNLERFFINKVVKQLDGYQIHTSNDKGDKCTIAIIKRQGIDFVTTHFIDIEMIGMFHIIEGFTLTLDIYDT